jgi:hypothetical protein
VSGCLRARTNHRLARHPVLPITRYSLGQELRRSETGLAAIGFDPGVSAGPCQQFPAPGKGPARSLLAQFHCSASRASGSLGRLLHFVGKHGPVISDRLLWGHRVKIARSIRSQRMGSTPSMRQWPWSRSRPCTSERAPYGTSWPSRRSG